MAAWATTLVALQLDALQLDHALIAVADLATAGREIEARHGLASIEGGRHLGWGTANRIVPVAEAYLELVAVVDEAEAAQSSFGSWVAQEHRPHSRASSSPEPEARSSCAPSCCRRRKADFHGSPRHPPALTQAHVLPYLLVCHSIAGAVDQGSSDSGLELGGVPLHTRG